MPTSTCVRRDFTRFIGDEWPFDFVIATESGDLTGATEIVFVVLTRAGGTEKFRETIGDGITVSGDKALVRCPAADTALITSPGRYYYVLRETIGGKPITTNDGFIYAKVGVPAVTP